MHASTLVVRGHGVARSRGDRRTHGRRPDRCRAALAPRRTDADATGDPPRRGVVRRARAGRLRVDVAAFTLTCAAAGSHCAAGRADPGDGDIPEEFPVVLAVFLALGAWRMAQHRALVRRTPAIEALGAITVLCTDKTGTLTENRMAVAELRQQRRTSSGLHDLRRPRCDTCSRRPPLPAARIRMIRWIAPCVTPPASSAAPSAQVARPRISACQPNARR